MEQFVSPVYNVQAVPVDKVQANDYNPNRVAPPEMKLLELSIGKMVLPSRWFVIMTKMPINISWLTDFTVIPL